MVIGSSFTVAMLFVHAALVSIAGILVGAWFLLVAREDAGKFQAVVTGRPRDPWAGVMMFLVALMGICALALLSLGAFDLFAIHRGHPALLELAAAVDLAVGLFLVLITIKWYSRVPNAWACLTTLVAAAAFLSALHG